MSSDDVLGVQRRESSELRDAILGLVHEAQDRQQLSRRTAAEEITLQLMALIDGLSLHATLHPHSVTYEQQVKVIERAFADMAP